MRKRTIKNVADTIFWYVLYFLPVIAYMCYLMSIRFNIGVTTEEPIETVAVMEEPTEKYYATLPAGTDLIFDEFAVDSYYDYFSIGILASNGTDTEGNSIRWYYSCMCFKESFSTFPVDYNGHLVVDDLMMKTVRDWTFEVPSLDFFGTSALSVRGYWNKSGVALASVRGSAFVYTTEYVYEEAPTIVDTTIPMEYNFEAFVDRVGFGFVSDNVVVDGLMDIFGENGVMPFFTTKTPFIILVWFVGVYLLHLLVDFLLFIPRLAHKWLKKCTEGE